MPRPQSKDELIEASLTNYNKLISLIDSLSNKELSMEFAKGSLNRNVRDVVAHLYHWNIMTLDWYEVGMKGEYPHMPAKGYTWKTLPELNKMIQAKYTNIEFEDAIRLFEQSVVKLRRLISSHTDEELFEKKRYKWTGSTSMGSYFTSATSSHYDWAYKFIRKSLKNAKNRK